jgi:transposase
MDRYVRNRLRIEGNLTKNDFLKLYRSCKDARLKERYHALLLGHDYTWDEVARILHRSSKQIRKWVKKYNKYGIEGLKSRKQKGSQSKLSKEQDAELKEIVSNDPRGSGYNFSNWNTKNLKEVIGKKFRAVISQETVRRTLHRLGFVWKKPEHRFVLSDDAEKERFKEQVAEAIAERKPNEVIMFEDECTTRQHPTLKKTWIMKGLRKFIGTFGNHAKKEIFGFVNILTGNTITRVTGSQNSEEFIAALGEVKKKYRGKKIKLFIDKAPWHTSDRTKQYIKNNSKWLEVIYLPTQSPELNPVEELWQHMRNIVTHNHLFSTIKELTDALLSFFANLTRKDVLSICGGTYS